MSVRIDCDCDECGRGIEEEHTYCSRCYEELGQVTDELKEENAKLRQEIIILKKEIG